MKYFGKIGAVLLGIGFILTVAGGLMKFLILFIGLLFIFTGIVFLLYWSTKGFVWKCTGCDNEFKISLTQNIFGTNMGVNDKLLYCPFCKQKVECKGRKIE